MPRSKHESIIARESEQVICLTNKDAEIFFNCLDAPPEANKKLKNAVKKYQINNSQLNFNRDTIRS